VACAKRSRTGRLTRAPTRLAATALLADEQIGQAGSDLTQGLPLLSRISPALRGLTTFLASPRGNFDAVHQGPAARGGYSPESMRTVSLEAASNRAVKVARRGG